MRIDPIWIFAGVIIVALAMTPFILAEARLVFKDIREAFLEDISQIFGGDDDEGNGDGDEDETGNGEYTGATGGTSVGMRIYYEDGSERDFTPSELSIFPFAIYDSGKIVQKIEMLLGVKCEWTGTYSGWSLKANIKSSILGYTLVDTQNLGFDNTKNGHLENGKVHYVTAGYLYASEIEEHLSERAYQSGTFTLRIDLYEASFFITLDGELHSRTKLTSSTSWIFDYSRGNGTPAQISSLSVSIQSTTYSL